MRCLQDPRHNRRGIGRHALALLQNAPPDLVLIGICDPAMPDLLPDARRCVSDIVNNAYDGIRRARGFVQLAPFPHDPLFVARLMRMPGLYRASVVYDFIPWRHQELYISRATARANYALGLSWLNDFDFYGAISESAARDLTELFGKSREAISVTGAALASHFPPASGALPPRHVLVVAGNDPRKNQDIGLRAHAASQRLQEARVPIRIVGRYPDHAADRLRAVAVEAGGDPRLVDITGEIPDGQLIESYLQAHVAVVPAFDEGFSLPVVEAMSARIPCIASNIPAHRELLTAPDDRFGADDEATLRSMIERAVFDEQWRRDAIARQAPVWPRFRAVEVAARFWKPLVERLDGPAAPAVSRRARPRVALFTPVPPDRSGIADYNAAAIAELGKLVELDVFAGTNAPEPLRGAARVGPLDAFGHTSPAYDRVVSVLGNSSRFHLGIFGLFRRYGGACIVHDSRMFSFYRTGFGIEKTLTLASRELGRTVSLEELQIWQRDDASLPTLFLSEVAESASPMLVHSRSAAELIGETYGVEPVVLPFAVHRNLSPTDVTPSARREARARIGVSEGEMLVASFGQVHPTKAPAVAVSALALLRDKGLAASLHFVGDIGGLGAAAGSLRASVEEMRLADHVRFFDDHVDWPLYRDYMVAADIAVQLRSHGFGSLSAALLDCVTAGIPTVANEDLAEAAGVPAEYVWTVPDRFDAEKVAAAMINLLQDGPGAGEREDVRVRFCEQRGQKQYAESLCLALGLEVDGIRALKKIILSDDPIIGLPAVAR